MKCIAAVDNNWAIGKGGKLLVSIPEDMKYFRDTTMDGVVVMGRKTLESFPGGKPLSGRVNIVFTRDKKYSVKDAVIVHDVEQLHSVLEEYNDKEIFVIGGSQIYNLLIDECDTAYITKIDFSYEADAYFPDLDKDDSWVLSGESDENTYFNLAYTYCTYKKVSMNGR